MSKTILGVDIGINRLKVALCRGGKVLKSAVADMPEGLIYEDKLTSSEAMGILLKETLRQNGIRCKHAAMILPGEQSYLRVVNPPLMSREQLEVNLPYEFSDYISDDLTNYVYDYAMLSDPRKSEDGHMDIMAVAAPKSLLAETRALLKKAGLKLVRLVPPEVAYPSIFRVNAPELIADEHEYCVVDLGYSAARVYMFRGGRHMVTRRLEQGLHVLDEACALLFDCEKEQAHSYFMSNHEDCQHSEVCMGLYDEIAVELMRSLNFYRFSTPDSSLEDVWLCGGGIMVPPLRKAIEDTVGVTVHEITEILRGNVDPEHGVGLSRAVGATIE